MISIAIAAGLLSAPAFPPEPAAQPIDRIGRIYSYVRSDRDGSEAEIIRVFRASRTQIEVIKMRGRCNNSAYVTAELDIERGYALRHGGGRLRPNAGREEFAVITYDPARRRIVGHVDLPTGRLALGIDVPDTPFHVYDIDLASLTITNQYRTDPRADFSFGMPIIWPDGGPEGLMRYMGRADLRFVREEMRNGRRAYRFEAGGPAFGARGGPIWFDAAEGHIIAAEWGIPNHSEHRDFALRLTGVSDGGGAEWRRLLTAHYENCPA